MLSSSAGTREAAGEEGGGFVRRKEDVMGWG